MTKRNIKLHIAYDGTRYFGFQRLQDQDNTIQNKLEVCLSRLLEEEIKVIGSSRTDAGVHALDQVVNFYTLSKISQKELQESLNKFLPNDIIVCGVEEVLEQFHCRYWSEKKTYLYRIHTDSIPPLFERNYVYHLGKKLNIEKMKEAASLLVGVKDFQGFCNRKMKKSTIRTMHQIEIIEEEKEVKLYLTADGFLYNMVRIIVGTLIEIGLDLKDKNIIPHILTSEERSEAGYLVPANGLVLYKSYFVTNK